MQDIVSAGTFSGMLGMSGRSVNVTVAFKHLQALIVVPALDTGPVYAFHRSFLQFLEDKEHAKELLLSKAHLAMCHHRLADACLQALQSTCAEIAQMRSKETQSTTGDVALSIRRDSVYGGSHWIHHVIQCAPEGYQQLLHSHPTLAGQFSEFIRHRLGDWLRWMCVIGQISIVPAQLLRLCDWLKDGPLLEEARRAQVYSETPSYREAVPFCWPRDPSVGGYVEISPVDHVVPESPHRPTSTIQDPLPTSPPSPAVKSPGQGISVTGLGFAAGRFAFNALTTAGSASLNYSAGAVLSSIQASAPLSAPSVATLRTVE
ncbi:hypothetical protein BDV98DRAFT_570501 [Pterulicium gracile]|uniref:Uncharacterized protein n=1 Tax=Pterulicium gracile TaxID=1884261 RepID=A0A5C3QD06_9AGAR|nr:hypothetical protein BDV98DRAFT_570501 [Pterula gracilis]